LANKHLIHQ